MGRRYLPGPWVNNVSAKEIAKAAEIGDEKKIKIVSLGIEKLLNLSEKYYMCGNSILLLYCLPTTTTHL